MEQVWNGILDFLSKFVTPDWGGVIGLLPILMGGLVALFLVLIALAFAFAGPTHRGRQRVRPIPPPGVHEGQPSVAPLLVAVGAAILFFGVVFRGPILAAGLVVTVLALLYWGAEAIRDWERVAAHDETEGGHAAAGAGSVAVTSALKPLESLAGPPLPRLSPPAEPLPALGPGGVAPGGESRTRAESMHAPVPSFRPLLVALASAVVFFGLVFGPAILVAGVLMLVIALVGWLVDAGAEYRSVVRADRTGHVEPLPAPRYPIAEAALFAVVLVLGITARLGVFPFQSTVPAAAPLASPVAGGNAAGGGQANAASPTLPPAGSTANAGGGQGAGATLKITAQGIKFDVQSLNAPANTKFTIQFTNDDAGVPHNVAVHKDSPSGQEVFQGAIVTGPTSTTYNIPALPAGTYAFVCSVHPNMQGTLTVH